MDPAIFTYFVVFAVWATGATACVLLAGSRPIGVPRIVVAALVALISIAVFYPNSIRRALGIPVRFDGFGGMQLVWITAALVVPCCGAAVLRRRGGATRPARAVAWLGVAALALPIYAMGIEPRRLQLERATVRVPGLIEPLRICVLADLQCSHITGHERRAIERLNAERPDLVLVAGDLFQGTEHHFERALDDYAELLRSIEAPGGVWYVRGDVDGGSTFERLAEAADLRVLRGESTTFELRGTTVELFGIDRYLDRRDELLAFLRAPRPEGAHVRLVLSHRPDPALGLPRELGLERPQLDLFVAGHTHGGQVVVPFYGPPITLSRVPRAVGAGGLHDLEGVPIYVSRGVGMERGHAPRVRFFCPPEIAVVTLAPAGAAP